jgi:hypothetical protein
MIQSFPPYVEEALKLGGFELDADARQRVALEFERIAAIAALLSEEPLGVHGEPLPSYRP